MKSFIALQSGESNSVSRKEKYFYQIVLNNLFENILLFSPIHHDSSVCKRLMNCPFLAVGKVWKGRSLFIKVLLIFYLERLEWRPKPWVELEEFCLCRRKLLVRPWRRAAGRWKVESLDSRRGDLEIFSLQIYTGRSPASTERASCWRARPWVSWEIWGEIQCQSLISNL